MSQTGQRQASAVREVDQLAVTQPDPGCNELVDVLMNVCPLFSNPVPVDAFLHATAGSLYAATLLQPAVPPAGYNRMETEFPIVVQ